MSDLGGGVWQARDGSHHYTKESADQHNNLNVAGGGAAGGAAASGIVAIAIVVVIIGPIIAAKVVSWVFGLLGKLGIVGKVIQTLLMVFLGPAIMLMLLWSVGRTLPGYIGNGLMLSSFILSPIWYFLYHYDVVQKMGASEFSAKIKNFFMFVWFGGIGTAILGKIIGYGSLITILQFATALAGGIYYIVSTRPYAAAVKESNKNSKTGLKAIVMGIGVVFALFISVGSEIEPSGQKAINDAKKAELTEIRENIGGQTLKVITSTLDIRANASYDGDVLKTLKQDDIVNATGSITNGLWIPVESEGVNGYIFALSVMLGNKNDFAFDNYPYDAVAAVPITVYNWRSRNEVELEQGTEVTVMSNSIYIEVKNFWYQIRRNSNAAEMLVPMLNEDGSLIKLSTNLVKDFNLKPPFQAIVTEDIFIEPHGSGGSRIPLPAGQIVTVDEFYGRDRAEVSFDRRKDITVSLKYLKIVE